jgi:hypothetical protein
LLSAGLERRGQSNEVVLDVTEEEPS